MTTRTILIEDRGNVFAEGGCLGGKYKPKGAYKKQSGVYFFHDHILKLPISLEFFPTQKCALIRFSLVQVESSRGARVFLYFTITTSSLPLFYLTGYIPDGMRPHSIW